MAVTLGLPPEVLGAVETAEWASGLFNRRWLLLPQP